MAPRLPGILFATACLSADAARRSSSGPAIPVKFGSLLGSQLDGCERWLGIPFAEPPVGDLRFEHPKPWQNAYPAEGRDATKEGSACIQSDGKGDEDCLFLNIWRPRGVVEGAKLPVMVWIHGGGFVSGSGTLSLQFGFHESDGRWLYDGCNLANKHDVIVVTLNYRLSMFGFGAFERDGGVSTNWAMEDQREALRWLRSDVSAFGGDPDKVTLFGESAGGISIYHHLATPASRGLFQGAIIESGNPSAKELRPALEQTRDMGRRLGCDDPTTLLACLRSKTPKQIQDKDDGHSILNPNIRTFMRWEPVLDGVELEQPPLQVFNQGKSNPVPVIAGSNTDEGTMFTFLLYPTKVKDNRYKQIIEDVWRNIPGHPSEEFTQEEVDRLLQVYPPQNSILRDNRPTLAEVSGDAMFVCSTRLGMRFHSQHSPAWVYRFNFRRNRCRYQIPLNGVPGVFHTMEIGYVFNYTTGCTPEQEALDISSRMQKYWTDFAKNLDPGATWPRYTNSEQKELTIEAVDRIADHYKENYCREWEQLLFSKVMW